MAISEAYAGSEAVSTTEHSMTTDTAGPDVDATDGIYQAFLDLSDMILGDVLEFRVYEKVGAATTQRVCLLSTFQHAQGTDGAIWVSPPLVLLHGWDMTLKATTGTVTVEWSIRKVA